MRWGLSIGLLIFAGCTHDLVKPLELEVELQNQQAREKLADADFEGARKLYESVLLADASNAEAAFGYVVSDLLMITLWEPVAALFDVCYLEKIDLAREVFGDEGVLGREAQAKAGTSNLEILLFPQLASGATRIDFQPTSIKSETYTEGDGGRRIGVRLYDARTQDGAYVSISFNPDDLTRNDGTTVVPYEDGARVSLADLDGSVYIFDPARLGDATQYFFSTFVTEGRLHFVKSGRRAGAPIVIELEGVRLPADCATEDCTASYELKGQVEDVISEQVNFREEALPFYGLEADRGDPQRPAEIVAIEQCAAIETAYVLSKLRQIGDRLAHDGEILEAVSNADAAFRFSVPRQLLHAERDLTLSVVDGRVLQAMLLVGGALIEMISQWQVADGSIQEMIATFTYYRDPSGMMLDPISLRDFEPQLVVRKLAEKMLARASGFDLSRVKARFDGGLEAMALAIQDTSPTAEGIFDFRPPVSRRTFVELGSFASTLRNSLESAGPVAWPDAPLYKFHLGELFVRPLDREKVMAGTRVPYLVSLAQPDGEHSNRRVIWEGKKFADETWKLFESSRADMPLIEAWTGGAVDLPAEDPNTCASSADCGQGYSCPSGQCVPSLPRVMTEDGWESAFRDEWPVFLNPGVRDAFGF